MCLPFVCFGSSVRVTLVVLAAVCWYSNLCLSCVADCLPDCVLCTHHQLWPCWLLQCILCGTSNSVYSWILCEAFQAYACHRFFCLSHDKFSNNFRTGFTFYCWCAILDTNRENISIKTRILQHSFWEKKIAEEKQKKRKNCQKIKQRSNCNALGLCWLFVKWFSFDSLVEHPSNWIVGPPYRVL